MTSAHPLHPHDWPTYRDLRLRALLDSPDAFASTHAAESARSDHDWSARINTAITSGQSHIVLATDEDTPCGLAWGKLSADEPGTADLFQMWVAPESRGKGIGQALLDAILDWARLNNVQRIRLGVTATDSPAMRMYTARGFEPVGPLEPLRESSLLMSQPLELELTARGN